MASGVSSTAPDGSNTSVGMGLVPVVVFMATEPEPVGSLTGKNRSHADSSKNTTMVKIAILCVFISCSYYIDAPETKRFPLKAKLPSLAGQTEPY